MREPHDLGDDEAILSLIGGHFDALKWRPGTRPDWGRFSADFLSGAQLFPASRPVQARTLNAFIDRMNGVAQSSLHTFEERTLGMQVLRFGNVAVVMAASEMLENGTDMNRDMSAYLLVKTEGSWRIAAHAWDKATEQVPVPPHLL